jgi:hypothetical protein
MRMTMTLILSSSLLVLACADDGGDVGDGLADDAADVSGEGESGEGESGTSESSTSESSTSEGTTEGTTANESSTGTDETGSETSTAGESDSGSETGDPSCEDDEYLGAGIGPDGWGLGSLCDDIWVCASADQVAALEALDPVVTCEPGMGCADQHCQLSYQVIVDQPTLDRVCEALLLPGIDVAYCSVYGP